MATTEVAQMSGDATIRPTYYVRHPDGSFSVADPQPILRRYCAAQPQPVHMQVDMRQMLVNIAHHWGRTITPDDESMFAEFITLAASHPSNAAGQDVPTSKVGNFLAMVKVWVERDGGNMDDALSWMYSDKPAATVPQVVQVPSDEQIIECWNHWQEIPVVNSDEAVIKCFRELLTTASNAGEAVK